MTPLYVLLAGTAAPLLLHWVAGRSPAQHWPNALRWGLAAMFVVTGTSHFVGLRDDLIAIVPPALPAPALLVTLTGVLELAGAAGLLWRLSASSSAAALTALLVALFPANIYAALSDIELGGEPATALPLRAVLQALYVAVAMTVWFTHRHGSATLRFIRSPRRPHAVVALPDVIGPTGGQASPGIVLISRLELQHLRDVPGFLRASLQLRRDFPKAGGAIWLRLAASPTSRTFWTWSAWTDEGALTDYTRSRAHRDVMAAYRARLHDTRFETLRPGDTALPGDWGDVRPMVASRTDDERAQAAATNEDHTSQVVHGSSV
jgi:uncharacterized membrane protein